MEHFNLGVVLFSENISSFYEEAIGEFCIQNNMLFSLFIPKNSIKDDVDDLRYLNCDNIIVIYVSSERTNIYTFNEPGGDRRLYWEEVKNIIKEFYPNAIFITDMVIIKQTFNIMDN